MAVVRVSGLMEEGFEESKRFGKQADGIMTPQGEIVRLIPTVGAKVCFVSRVNSKRIIIERRRG